eukprot:comp22387_c0_seq1/m.54341 comp22387_c0_seq1/g.54341  ORF comp22387_c0_seq1/g.54341 comp22387_c0_seq1/m.54341 type:complete len:375 (+) comp22387_c0_seq1:1494-2618(+)
MPAPSAEAAAAADAPDGAAAAVVCPGLPAATIGSAAMVSRRESTGDTAPVSALGGDEEWGGDEEEEAGWTGEEDPAMATGAVSAPCEAGVADDGLLLSDVVPGAPPVVVFPSLGASMASTLGLESPWMPLMAMEWRWSICFCLCTMELRAYSEARRLRMIEKMIESGSWKLNVFSPFHPFQMASRVSGMSMGTRRPSMRPVRDTRSSPEVLNDARACSRSANPMDERNLEVKRGDETSIFARMRKTMLTEVGSQRALRKNMSHFCGKHLRMSSKRRSSVMPMMMSSIIWSTAMRAVVLRRVSSTFCLRSTVHEGPPRLERVIIEVRLLETSRVAMRKPEMASRSSGKKLWLTTSLMSRITNGIMSSLSASSRST